MPKEIRTLSVRSPYGSPINGSQISAFSQKAVNSNTLAYWQQRKSAGQLRQQVRGHENRNVRGQFSIVDVGNAQQIFKAAVQQSTLAIPRLKAVNVAIYSAFNADLNSKLCAVNQGIYA
jgi:hypothetical protein